jgi:hypothetical protein
MDRKTAIQSNKGRTCKACGASFRTELDEMILNRDPWRKIQNFCDDRGLSISTTALTRHAKNHIENYNQPPRATKVEYDREPVEFRTDEPVQVDRLAILRELGFDETALQNPTPVEYYELITKSLDRLTVETYLCAIGAMQRYQAGNGRFPSEQINTLDRLTRISSALVSRLGNVNTHDPGKVERLEKRNDPSLSSMSDLLEMLRT